MHRGASKELSFFKGRDQVFVYSIIPFLQPRLMKSGEIIYEEDEHADEIYFIVKGRVNYVYNNGDELMIYKSVQRGAYFGDIEVIK
jgi:hyperpolarization activated cyclic nucleotide-gated potassium channel 1